MKLLESLKLPSILPRFLQHPHSRNDDNDERFSYSKTKILVSYSIDWIITIILFVILTVLVNHVHGYFREFDLTDTSIQHTTVGDNERVPMKLLGVIIGLIPLLILITFSTLVYRSVVDLHHSLLGFLLTAALTLTTTTCIKVMVGRPRPDFISRCLPPLEATNSAIYGLATSSICTGEFEKVKDGFRSFPSGHSSSSFALLSYLSFYLSGKLGVFNTKGHTTKVWIAYTPMLGAALIAVSRSMDYRHHATDLIAGAIIGLVCSYFCYHQYYPPLTDKFCHKPFNTRFIEQNYVLPTHQRGYQMTRLSHETHDNIVRPEMSYNGGNQLNNEHMGLDKDKMDEIHLKP